MSYSAIRQQRQLRRRRLQTSKHWKLKSRIPNFIFSYFITKIQNEINESCQIWRHQVVAWKKPLWQTQQCSLTLEDAAAPSDSPCGVFKWRPGCSTGPGSVWRWCQVKLNLAPCWLMSSSWGISPLKILLQVESVMSRDSQEDTCVCICEEEEVRFISFCVFKGLQPSLWGLMCLKSWSSIKKKNRLRDSMWPHRRRLVHHGPAAPGPSASGRAGGKNDPSSRTFILLLHSCCTQQPDTQTLMWSSRPGPEDWSSHPGPEDWSSITQSKTL